MGSLFSLLNVARDGMQAQTSGLSTTGQNITNANTPGFVRRNVILSTLPSNNGSDGGVTAEGITRSFDQFAYGRVVLEHSKQGAANARGDALTQAEGVIAPKGQSIADKMNPFFAAINTLSGFPMDLAARADVLTKATDLVGTIQSTAGGLNQTRVDLLAKAQGVATEVNLSLAKIADLNKQIVNINALGEPAADLRDRRDQLIRDVADRIGAKSVEDSRGNVTLFAAGSALVDGSTASSLSISLDPAGALVVTSNRPGGSTADITKYANEGSLGGIREARDTDIPALSTSLDQFAFDFANKLNAIHSSGVGLDGVGGRNLFVPPAAVAGAAYNLKLDPSVIGSPDHLAAAANASQLPAGNDIAVKLAQAGTAPLAAAGGTPSDRFGSIAGSIGSLKASADAERSLRSETVAQAQTLNESASGVSLDEEMVNVTRYQRAFEASTRVLKVADELLNQLMQGL